MDPRVFKFRWTTFAFAIFCFMLPFVTLSCPGQTYTFNGIEASFGGSVEGEKLSGEPLFAFAFVALIVALATCFSKDRGVKLVSGVAGALAALLLLIGKGVLLERAVEEGRKMVRVSFNAGYWLALLSSAAGAVIVGRLLWVERLQALERTLEPGPDEVSRPADAGAGGSRGDG
jgi:hypothetical protein